MALPPPQCSPPPNAHLDSSCTIGILLRPVARTLAGDIATVLTLGRLCRHCVLVARDEAAGSARLLPIFGEGA